tara:strand:+ start:185 stop:385 length:201 start_codon:yes stop_codon:yes gene_type:complete
MVKKLGNSKLALFLVLSLVCSQTTSAFDLSMDHPYQPRALAPRGLAARSNPRALAGRSRGSNNSTT